jgi:ATP:ADP antiporter, AAA family
LNKYLKMGIGKIADHHTIPEYNKENEIVKNSLLSEIKEDLTVSLKICSMLFRKKPINRILELMEIEQQQKLYNAMEMIELELPKNISKDLIMLFDFMLDPSGNKAAAGKNDSAALFNKIYFSDSFSYNPWTKAILLYCSWKNNKTADLRNIVQKIDQGEHYIITETRDFVLNAIN